MWAYEPRHSRVLSSFPHHSVNDLSLINRISFARWRSQSTNWGHFNERAVAGLCIFYILISLQECMATKAFCVLVLHALRCSALFLFLHPAWFQMAISDKNAQLCHCSDAGMRSFPLYTSSLRFTETPERACPSQWELIENKYPRQLLSNTQQIVWIIHILLDGTIIFDNSNARIQIQE